MILTQAQRDELLRYALEQEAQAEHWQAQEEWYGVRLATCDEDVHGHILAKIATLRLRLGVWEAARKKAEFIGRHICELEAQLERTQ